MSLETIAKEFARQHGIILNERRNGLIGRKDRLVIGYWDNGIRQNVFATKSFPPLDGAYESRVLIADDGQQPVLKMRILYGCLEDYLTQLDKVRGGDLYRVVQGMLIDEYFTLTKETIYAQPPEKSLQQEFLIDIPGHYPDLWKILKSFYPSK